MFAFYVRLRVCAYLCLFNLIILCQGIKDQIGQPEIGQRDFKFTVFAFDNDSQLNCEENKDKLRQAGLNDELDVGRWIAEKLEANKQSDLSQRVFNFIQGKEKSTLNSNKVRIWS